MKFDQAVSEENTTDHKQDFCPGVGADIPWGPNC